MAAIQLVCPDEGYGFGGFDWSRGIIAWSGGLGKGYMLASRLDSLGFAKDDESGVTNADCGS